MIATKTEFVELLQGLFKTTNLQGKNFSLVVTENIKIIQESIKDLEHKGIPSKEFIKLANKVQELQKEEDAQEKIDALELEYADVIKERREQIANIKNSLDVEVELELVKLSKEDLPEDISAEQLLAIDKIIE